MKVQMKTRTIDTSKPIRKPVEITGCPEALDFVTNLQLAEFEETLLAKRVEELPISMLMSFVGHQWWSRMLATSACYYGFVEYCKEVTDKMILDNRVFTGFMCDAGGCWTDPRGVVAIDWAREKILLGPKETSFAKMTVREFDDLLSSDAASIYWIPGTGERYPTAPSDWNSWYGKYNRGGISRDHYYRVNSHSLGDGACDNIMDKDKPWFLLKEEWEEILRRRAKISRPKTTAEKKAAMPSQKGIFMMSWIDNRNEAVPRANIRRIDSVKVVPFTDEIKKDRSADKSRLMEDVYDEKRMRNITDWVKDKQVVKVDCSEVSADFGSIEARHAVEYFRLCNWIPFDDPEIMRRKYCPTEKMPMERVTEYTTATTDWFTCKKELVEQMYQKYLSMDPSNTVSDRFAEVEDMLRKADKKPKVKLPDEGVYDSDRKVPYVYSDHAGNMVVYTANWDDAHVKCGPYSKKAADQFYKTIKSMYEGKWIWHRDRAVRIDRVVMKEKCHRTDVFKKELNGDYMWPEIKMYGREIDISSMRPRENEHYSTTVELRDRYNMKKITLDNALKEQEKRMTVTTIDEIVDSCKKSGQNASSIMRHCYDEFVKGLRDLIDGKSPKFKIEYPSDTLKGE